MKLVIGSYEVTVSAKYKGEKASPKTTEAFLNEVSGAFFTRAKESEAMNCPACAEREREMANDIFNFLEARGAYKGLGESK